MPRTVFIINKPCLNILLSESSTDRIRAGGCIARSDTYFFCRAVAFAVMVIAVCHIAGNSLVFLAGLAGAGIFSCIIHNNFYPFLSGKNILRSYFYIILKKLIEKMNNSKRYLRQNIYFTPHPPLSRSPFCPSLGDADRVCFANRSIPRRRRLTKN